MPRLHVEAPFRFHPVTNTQIDFGIRQKTVSEILSNARTDCVCQNPLTRSEVGRWSAKCRRMASRVVKWGMKWIRSPYSRIVEIMSCEHSDYSTEPVSHSRSTVCAAQVRIYRTSHKSTSQYLQYLKCSANILDSVNSIKATSHQVLLFRVSCLFLPHCYFSQNPTIRKKTWKAFSK